MSVSSIDLQGIDVLSDSLSFLGDDYASMYDDGIVKYGELVLNIAPKVGLVPYDDTGEIRLNTFNSQEGKALTLLADQLFSPALLLAERIEIGMMDVKGKTVVELGAGCALPSLLAATLPHENAPSMVVITDYPDELLLANLRINLHANARLVADGCFVVCEGHEWGVDASPVLQHLARVGIASPSPTPESLAHTGFDVVLLSDLLHFHNSHPAILASLTSLLVASPHARAYIAAGTYTPPHVCANFVKLAEQKGLVMTEGAPGDIWCGKKEVWRSGVLDANALGVRKSMCRWWEARWTKEALASKSNRSQVTPS